MSLFIKNGTRYKREQDHNNRPLFYLHPYNRRAWDIIILEPLAVIGERLSSFRKIVPNVARCQELPHHRQVAGLLSQERGRAHESASEARLRHETLISCGQEAHKLKANSIYWKFCENVVRIYTLPPTLTTSRNSFPTSNFGISSISTLIPSTQYPRSISTDSPSNWISSHASLNSFSTTPSCFHTSTCTTDSMQLMERKMLYRT